MRDKRDGFLMDMPLRRPTKPALTALVITLFFLTSCAGRAPSPNAAHSLSNGFFKSYGKKYKSSILGQSPLDKVEVNRIQEQSRGVAEVESLIYFKDGRSARVLMTTRKHPLFGWSVASWEVLETR